MFTLPKERRGIFVTGLVLTLTFSFFIGLLNIGVLYLLGLPFLGLAAGIALIWFSKISTLSKSLLSISSILIIVGTFLLFLFINTAEGETFLIPKDYRGEIVVFYAEPCGSPAKFENGRRVYELSPDGVLITQHTENKGYFNRRFYLVDDGFREEIAQFGRQDFETEKKEWGKYTSHASAGELTKDTVGVFWAYGRETYFASGNSTGYIVSDYQIWDRDAKSRLQEMKRSTERAVEQLERCRRDELSR